MPTDAALSKADYLNDPDRLYALARLPLMALAVGLALLVYLWSRELHGAAGGLLSLALFCFSPSFLAHAPLVGTDAGFAAFFFATIFFYRRALLRDSAADAAGAAACCGLAFVSKLSAPLLVPALALLAAAHAVQGPARGRRGRLLRAAALAAASLACAYAAVWAAYGFRFAAGPGPAPAFPWGAPTGGALDALLRWADAHRLAPDAYLYGLSFVLVHAAARASFLLGQRSYTGTRAFFPVAFAVKTPLPALALMGAGLWLAARRKESRAQLAWLLTAPAVYGAAALAARLDIGHRHILPLYPFLFVAAGAAAAPRRGWRPALLAGVGATLAALSALVVFAPVSRPALVYPDFLAYFNEAAGGPANGWRVLVDSDLDWGQGLKSLAAWLRGHDVPQPVNLCYFGTADPRFYGVRYVNLPGGLPFAPQADFSAARAPGWLAISATDLQAVYWSEDFRLKWARFLDKTDAQLAGVAGRSILVYRLRAPF